MKHDIDYQPQQPTVGVYECEIHLKFRLLEEKSAMLDREQLLELLLEAFGCGIDDYLETIAVNVSAQEIPEVAASPNMRRQLIRLRNSKDLL